MVRQKNKRNSKSGPSAAVRIRVMKRDKFRCTYCGISGNDAELEIDHIIPVSKGGSHHISNLTTACFQCNRQKGNKSIAPEGNGMGNNLDGKPIHIFRDSKIHNQGVIIGEKGDNFLVQRYSFLDGRPTDIIAVSSADMFNPEICKIYANDEEWHTAYFKELKEDGLLDGSVKDAVRSQLKGW